MIKSSFMERNLHILFPLPAIIFVALLMIFPVLYTLFLSFTNWNLTSGMPMSFNGVNSYIRVLSEPRFLHAVGRTFSFTFFAVLIEGFLGVAIALILNRAFVGRGVGFCFTGQRLPLQLFQRQCGIFDPLVEHAVEHGGECVANLVDIGKGNGRAA